MKTRPAPNAFTLVEMAIVLAIIGLLAGGIIGGQSLIRRAKISTIMSDLGKYRDAFNQFQVKYQALPGDYLDATEQWGTDPNGCPSHTTRVPKKTTCNGNGDGAITGTEMFRAWQHLSSAGMVDGTFTGVADSSGTGGITPGENAPVGPLSNSGYTLTTGAALTGNANYFDQPVSNQLVFGARVSNDWTYNPALTPVEQEGIDIKIDDSRPSTGWLRSFKSPLNPGCATTNVVSTAQYSVTQTGRNCTALLFIKPLT